jgi:rhamnose transport system substrate-binding protein
MRDVLRHLRLDAGGRASSNPPGLNPPVTHQQRKDTKVKRSLMKHLTPIGAILLIGVVLVATATAAAPLKTGLKVFVIPKNLGNPYFTTADSVKSGGALKALKDLKENGTETSGTQATAASQIPAIQAAITKGANALIVSATDASALCPTLKTAMAKKITVVTYDSDAPACRNVFINQADSKAIGESQVDLLASQIGKTGEIAVVSAAASATNQNAWIGFMKKQLTKYPNMKLVKTVYGNDDPATSLTVLQGLLSAYPNLKGIISPTTVGISTAARYLSTHKDIAAKVTLTGLGLPSQMKPYIHDGTVESFELWNPNDLGYLAGYAAASLASGSASLTPGTKFTAGKLNEYTVLAPSGDTGPSVVLGPPTVFDKSNVDQFNF